jgi:hypothetical protein
MLAKMLRSQQKMRRNTGKEYADVGLIKEEIVLTNKYKEV